MPSNVVDRAKQVLLAHLEAVTDGTATTLKLGANLQADRADLEQRDVVACAVAVEADPRRIFGSSVMRYGVAEIQVISSKPAGLGDIADTLMALHGWQQPADFPPDGHDLPADFESPAKLRDVIRGSFLVRTRTEEDDETGAIMRSFRYSLIFAGG